MESASFRAEIGLIRVILGRLEADVASMKGIGMRILNNHTIGSLLLAMIAGVFSMPASAGPTWPEGPEAGPLPDSSQKINGAGPILAISGSLGGPPIPGPLIARGLGGDFQDMYLVRIDDPSVFRASTDPDLDGFADFDTQLFLFTGPDHPDGPGLGIFANDESPSATGGESFINGNVNDGSMPPQLIANVHYFLAISGFDSDPGNAGGAIFNQALPEERSGPDGAGGMAPIENWNSNGDFGLYQISLQGVAGQTLCPNSDINNDGITDTADLGILIAQFGSPVSSLADLNADGVVDTADLGILIAEFGVQCP